MVDAGGPPVGRPIVVRVVGPDDGLRKKLADDIENFIIKLPGTKDINRDDKEGKQQVELKFNYKLMAKVGITVADIAQYVRIAFDGEVVTNVRYGDEDVDFRVIFKEDGKVFIRVVNHEADLVFGIFPRIHRFGQQAEEALLYAGDHLAGVQLWLPDFVGKRIQAR